MSNSYADYVLAFKALADETRLKIITTLADGQMFSCKILEEFQITQPTLSYHMKVLTESGLVNGVWDGAWMRYSLNEEKGRAIKLFLERSFISKQATSIRSGGKVPGG